MYPLCNTQSTGAEVRWQQWPILRTHKDRSVTSNAEDGYSEHFLLQWKSRVRRIIYKHYMLFFIRINLFVFKQSEISLHGALQSLIIVIISLEPYCLRLTTGTTTNSHTKLWKNVYNKFSFYEKLVFATWFRNMDQLWEEGDTSGIHKP
jgi:hypothetical protein